MVEEKNCISEVPEHSKRQLKESEAASIMNVSCDKLRHDRMINQGPPFRRFGRCIRYDYDELVAWMASQSSERK